MAIDYFRESERYRPAKITTLLVGEAPPPAGETYFYVPRRLSNAVPISMDRSLPSTIFNHYFGRRPAELDEYTNFLYDLQRAGVFLIDIHQAPIKVRDCPEGMAEIKRSIPKLREYMKRRGICIPDRKIVFLLARGDYKREIRAEYPEAALIRWMDFRMNVELLLSPSPNSIK